MPYNLLKLFLDDDEELANIYATFKSGQMLCGDIKAKAVEVVTRFIEQFRQNKSNLSMTDVENIQVVRKIQLKK